MPFKETSTDNNMISINTIPEEDKDACEEEKKVPKFECERKQKEFDSFQSFKEHIATKETPPYKSIMNRVATEELEDETTMKEGRTTI